MGVDSSASSGGRKRVSFGPYISPEYIDKHMPPSSPVRKGATPPSTPTRPAEKKPSASTPTSLLKKNMKKRIAEATAAQNVSA